MGLEEANLGLEVSEGAGGPQLRIVVEWVRGYAAESGAPAISDPCGTITSFEREAERLKQELDALLDEARERLGDPRRAAAGKGGKADEAASPARAARIETDLLVRDVMSTDVRVVDPNDPLAVADELMKQNRFRHAVVVGDGQLVGVLSQRDIFYGALAWSAGLGSSGHKKALESVAVKAVMQTEVVTIGPDAPLADAARLMLERRIGCLPVVQRGDLVGILTEGDFLSLLTDAAA